jgi:hypothetical protein
MSDEKSYDNAQRLDSHVTGHRYALAATGALSLGSSKQTMPGLAAALDAGGKYLYEAVLLLNFQSSGGNLSYRVHPTGGLTAAQFRAVSIELCEGVYPETDRTETLDNSLAGGNIGSGLSDRFTTVRGYIEVGVAGTLNIQVALSSGAGNSMQYGSFLDITPTS